MSENKQELLETLEEYRDTASRLESLQISIRDLIEEMGIATCNVDYHLCDMDRIDEDIDNIKEALDEVE